MKYTPDILSKMAETGILYVAHALSAITQVKPGCPGQLGMDHPDSHILTRPVRTAFAHGLTAAEPTGTGWTKLLLLTAVEEPEALEGLMHLAETETVRDLSRTLRGLENQGRARRVPLYFTKAEYAKLEKALLAFGAGKAGKVFLEKKRPCSESSMRWNDPCRSPPSPGRRSGHRSRLAGSGGQARLGCLCAALSLFCQGVKESGGNPKGCLLGR